MRPTSVRWRQLAFIFLVTVINIADRASISVGMPTIAKEFALSPAMQGVILSAFFWSYAALQVPSGWIIDRVGPSRVVAAATAVWGLFQGLAMFAGNGLFLLITRIGLGAAEAPVFPAGGKLIANWLAKTELGRGAILVDGGGIMGAALGGMTIAWLISALQSWRLAFGIAGVATILLGLGAFWVLRDDPGRHPGVNEAERAWIRGEQAQTVPIQVYGTFSWLKIAPVLAGRFGWAMVNFGLLTWMPSYLAQARGLDLKQMGSATFLIYFAGFLGSVTAGLLSDALMRTKLRRSLVLKGMLALSGAAMFAAFLFLPRISSVTHAVTLLAGTEFMLCWGGLYWTFPAIIAPRETAGIIGSLMNFAGSSGGVVVPVIAGFILQMTGNYDAVLYYFSICALLFILGTLLIPFPRDRET
jgi:MFS transporter, ACS family, D-galactonate transporter